MTARDITLPLADYELPTREQVQILGGNVRRTWSTIFRQRGYRR